MVNKSFKTYSMFSFSLTFCLVLFPVCLLSMAQQPKWLSEVLSCQQSGSWIVVDKSGEKILVQGELIFQNDGLISNENDLRALCDMYADVMVIPLEQCIESSICVKLWFCLNNIYYWESVRDRLYREYLKRIQDLMIRKNNNIAYIFTVSEFRENNKNVLLGSALFDVILDDKFKTIELNTIVVKPEAQGRGLSKILVSSLFKLLPQTERIILDVLYTNQNAQSIYESFGFKRYREQEYVFNYEYLTNNSSCQKLQKVATTFLEV